MFETLALTDKKPTSPQQEHPNNRTRNIERVYGQMRHGERPNKIPIYEKMLQAEGKRQTPIQFNSIQFNSIQFNSIQFNSIL